MAEENKTEENKTEVREETGKEAEEQEEMSLEETFQELEGVIDKMEQGDLSLEDSFTAYHQGMDLLKSCNDKIDKVEKQVLELDEQGEAHEFKS